MSTEIVSASVVPLQFSEDSNKLMVGLCWDHNENSSFGEIEAHDLDLSCALLGKGHELIDIITPSEPMRDKYKSIVYHSGDHMSGASEFEDEYINIQINKVDEHIEQIAFFVSSKDGLKLSEANRPECVFRNGITLEKYFSIDLRLADKDHDDGQGLFFAGAVTRHPQDEYFWDLQPVLKFISNDNSARMIEQMSNMLKL
jgi:stress response protein SCP2